MSMRIVELSLSRLNSTYLLFPALALITSLGNSLPLVICNSSTGHLAVDENFGGIKVLSQGFQEGMSKTQRTAD